jgi:hypothetical protein
MTDTLRRMTCAAIAAAAAGGGLAAAASGASASGASAASLSVNRACYVNVNSASGAPMTISGSGFTPGETVDVSGGTVYAQATAGTSGTFSVTTKAPILATVSPGTETTTLTATGETSQATATVSVHSANLAVQTSPPSVRNVRRDKVKFNFSGFTPGRHIFGFYARGRKTVRARFGVAHGPCGTLSQRALLFPGGRPTHDSYTVTFESSPRLSRTARPKITGKLTILRF